MTNSCSIDPGVRERAPSPDVAAAHLVERACQIQNTMAHFAGTPRFAKPGASATEGDLNVAPAQCDPHIRRRSLDLEEEGHDIVAGKGKKPPKVKNFEKVRYRPIELV